MLNFQFDNEIARKVYCAWITEIQCNNLLLEISLQVSHKRLKVDKSQALDSRDQPNSMNQHWYMQQGSKGLKSTLI